MKFEIKKMNLFDLSETHALVHCVSADFELGAGIAREFDKRYDTRYVIRKRYQSNSWHEVGYCIVAPKVTLTNGELTPVIFNLVTKKYYWYKPTYQTLKDSLIDLRMQIRNINTSLAPTTDIIHKIAMPKIGCGLDKLEWSKVEKMIKEIFDDVDIEITVCYI